MVVLLLLLLLLVFLVFIVFVAILRCWCFRCSRKLHAADFQQQSLADVFIVVHCSYVFLLAIARIMRCIVGGVAPLGSDVIQLN